MITRFHNATASSEQFTHEFAHSNEHLSQSDLLLAARRLGLKAKSAKFRLDCLEGTPSPAIADDSQGSFFWLPPAIVKHRKLLAQLLLVSFVLQIFALLAPQFFLLVMDKVLAHRGLDTLDVIALGLLGVMVFATLLSTLRSYEFSLTVSRIDVELGSRLVRQLTLPLSYFQTRRFGDLISI